MWYTRRRLDGPTRIGDSSGTNTVLFAHPLAQTAASASQALGIRIRITSHSDAAALEIAE